MEYIIGEGSERDRKTIPLSTCDGSHIPNFTRKEDPPEVRRHGIEIFKNAHPNAHLRSISSTYNCIGHLFGARRTWIEIDHLKTIFTLDGYRLITDENKLWVGDIVVYENRFGETTHVGQVVEIQKNLVGGESNVRVLSKWGPYGEYLHDLFDVSELIGKPKEYWTERREV